jgi:small-conductance mechanosensitive channel
MILAFTSADLGSGLLQALDGDLTIHKLLRAALALLLAVLALVLVQRGTDAVSERVAKRFRLLFKQALPFWKGLILLLTAAYLFNLFIDLGDANLLALTGTLAVAIGFAFRDYVSSIIAGIMTLFEPSYRVGDRVRIGRHYGEVVGYGLRSLQLRTRDDDLITVPHGLIWTEPVANANSGHLEAQVATSVFLDPRADVDLVIRLLQQAALTSRYTQLSMPIEVTMDERPWATQYTLRSYPIDARDEFRYRTDLLRRVKRAFRQARVPYPRPPLPDDPGPTRRGDHGG